MFKWVLGTIAGVVLGIGAYFFLYLGAFKPVLIAEKTEGPLRILYKDNIGAYHKIVPVLDEVEAWAKSQNLSCPKTFGEYLDDPRTIEEGRLRSHVGCILDSDPAKKVTAQLPEDFKYEVRLPKKYVTAFFEGSPGIGPMKVYPKVEEYFDAKHARPSGPTIEIYQIHSAKEMTTTYLFPME